MLGVLHLADLHLGRARAYMEERRRSERRRGWDDLLRRAVEFVLRPAKRIGMVVIVGDLFESHRPDRVLVGSVLESLWRPEHAGVRVVTVPGNHDEVTYADSVYRSREWAGASPGYPRAGGRWHLMTGVHGAAPAGTAAPTVSGLETADPVIWHRLVLLGFGPFRDEVRAEFAEGLTNFVAPNECGKSSLVERIAPVVFGLPGSSDPTAFGQARFRHRGHGMGLTRGPGI